MANVSFFESEEFLKDETLREGQTILRAAKQGRVALKHRCGGKAQCTTCKVVIKNQSGVSKPNEKELSRLGEDNITSGFRLSCQTKVLGSAEARIPEDPYKARIRALLNQQK